MSEMTLFEENARGFITLARNRLTDLLETPGWPSLSQLEYARADLAIATQFIEDFGPPQPSWEDPRHAPTGHGEIFDFYWGDSRFLKNLDPELGERIARTLLKARIKHTYRGPAGTWYTATLDEAVLAQLREAGVIALVASLIQSGQALDLTRIDQAERRFTPQALRDDAAARQSGARALRAAAQENEEQWRLYLESAPKPQSEADRGLLARAEQGRRWMLRRADDEEKNAKKLLEIADDLERTRRRGSRGPKSTLPPDEQLVASLRTLMAIVGKQAKACRTDREARRAVIRAAAGALGLKASDGSVRKIERTIWEEGLSRPLRQHTLALELLAALLGVTPRELRKRKLLKRLGLA